MGWLRRLPWVLPLGLAAYGFVAPDRAQREAAAGSLSSVKAEWRPAFREGGGFRAKEEPGAGDWLMMHEEAGQTYDQYVSSRPNRPNGRRNKLYLLPLGKFDEKGKTGAERLRRYTEAFYAPMKVEVLPAVPENEVKAASREFAGTKSKQWKSTDLLDWLPGRLPDDGYAMLAVTMTDLYPEESWNFVFGQASLKRRVGVFSFARYHPSWNGEEAGEEAMQRFYERAAKVLTHEFGHMFGVRHCIHYECLMNGANHLGEVDQAPVHACPVCLRKFHYALGFDPWERYRGLAAAYRREGMAKDAAWVEARLEERER